MRAFSFDCRRGVVRIKAAPFALVSWVKSLIRLLKPLLKISGWTVAHTPLPVLSAVSRSLGWLMLHAMPRRRHLVYSNLHHAFPGKDRKDLKHLATESSARLFETALLSIAFPYLNDARLRSMIVMGDSARRVFQTHHTSGRPMVIATFHMAYWEALTTVPLFLEGPAPEIGVVFRPLNQPAANEWVKTSRQRHGMRLLSRKEGLQEAFRILKRNGVVALLVDQNAGDQGTLSTLFGRVCSTSDLAGILVAKYHAQVGGVWAVRRGFWKMEFEGAMLAEAATSPEVTLGLNRLLETTLQKDENRAGSWLWSHGRWRQQEAVHRRFRIEARQSLLAEDLAARGWKALPKSTRIWIRLPNWLGDVVMALPLLKALRQSRPDAELTYIGKPAFFPLLEAAGVADKTLALPKRGRGYFRFFRELRLQYPDTYLLFTNSFRGDLEARLTGCRQRFGLVRPGKKRPLLSHRFEVPADYDEKENHLLDLWTKFFAQFGLTSGPDRTPLSARNPEAGKGTTLKVGFIAGSENTPAKRWPVKHWIALGKALVEMQPTVRLQLLGTPNDQAITRQIAAELPAGNIEDLAGKTDMKTYVQVLQGLDLLVTNDTGGMHLANALGVPMIALFGPTNPVRTGPVFSGVCTVLQPPGCPRTGGASLEELTPSQVVTEARRLLSPTPSQS